MIPVTADRGRSTKSAAGLISRRNVCATLVFLASHPLIYQSQPLVHFSVTLGLRLTLYYTYYEIDTDRFEEFEQRINRALVHMDAKLATCTKLPVN